MTESQTKLKVSIHAPVQGATKAGAAISAIGCFNPRSCARSDQEMSKTSVSKYVSIHAPVQGATRISWLKQAYTDVSIHAPVQGATQGINKTAVRYAFQSTLLCKERRHTGDAVKMEIGFNPRSCARSDFISWTSSDIPTRFNPRSCARSDSVMIM